MPESPFSKLYSFEPTDTCGVMKLQKTKTLWSIQPMLREDDLEHMIGIHKWQTIVLALFAQPQDPVFIEDGGETTCELCEKYKQDDCELCPVTEYGPFTCCEGTPYAEYADLENILNYVPIDDRSLTFEQLVEQAKFFALWELKWLVDIAVANQLKHVPDCEGLDAVWRGR